MSIVLWIVGSIVTLLVLFFFKFYILTKIRMNFLVKQGFVEYTYYPLYGIAKEWMDENSKDNLGQIKTLSTNAKFANKDGIVSNVQDKALLILTNPTLINEFMQNQNHYIKFEMPIKGFKQFLGNGITLSEGDEWKRKRKFLSNMFKFDLIVNYLGNIREVTKRLLDKSDIAQFNTISQFGTIAGAISLKLFMGANLDDYSIDGQNPAVAMDKFCEEIYLHYLTLFPMMFGQNIVKKNLREVDRKINTKCAFVRDFMRNILKDSIKREKKLSESNQKDHSNLITLLLKEGHSISSKEEVEDLLDISFNLYLAAKDTSTNLISNTLYYLITHPQYYKRVEEEVQKLPADYTFNDIQKLDFLAACIKESLRINTSAPLLFTREAISDHTLGKYKIQKGTFVNVGLITSQLDAQYFENPLEFDPDRWFRESTTKVIKEHPFAYIPFSGGMRNCIGQHLAQLQAKVIFVEFILKFKQPTCPKDYVFEMTVKQSYTTKYPLILELTEKSKK